MECLTSSLLTTHGCSATRDLPASSTGCDSFTLTHSVSRRAHRSVTCAELNTRSPACNTLVCGSMRKRESRDPYGSRRSCMLRGESSELTLTAVRKPPEKPGNVITCKFFEPESNYAGFPWCCTLICLLGEGIARRHDNRHAHFGTAFECVHWGCSELTVSELHRHTILHWVALK
jgi:hypothetical protein